MVFGDLSKEISELVPFNATQRGAEVILMLAGDAPQRLELGSTRRRQPKRVGAPVIRPWAPLDQALSLEAVDQQHQTAGKGSEELGQRSLRHVRLVRQVPENTRLRRGQAKWGQALGEAGGRMCAELSEQERGPRTPRSLGHSY